jgi:hypothetical protein
MTTDPTAVEKTPLNQGPAENQNDELPDNGLSGSGPSAAADSQVNAVQGGGFTERGDNAENAAFEGDGEYSGGEFAGGDVERDG